jgi:hypothetical protein
MVDTTLSIMLPNITYVNIPKKKFKLTMIDY